MRIARLAIEASGRTMDLEFHPRLTVVTGVGSATRESLIQELIGGLGTNRSGTHLELVTDAERKLTVFRPPDAAHRVLDSTDGRDLSEEFRSSTGLIDVLSAHDLDVASARRWLRVGPNDLIASTNSHQIITRLANINQSELWSAAQRVQIAELAIAEKVEDGFVEDTHLTDRIDHSYHSLDKSVEQADQTRLLALVVGTFAIVGAALVSVESPTAAFILLGIAAAATVVTFVFRARVNHYKQQLEQALGEAGSDSYLGYQLDRIDNYIGDEHRRRHETNAKADQREAAARWHTIAGDVPVDWVIQHRPAIETASRLHSAKPDNSDGPESGELVPIRTEDVTPELIESLLDRLSRARQLGRANESFPVLLDEPFGTLDPSIRPALLEKILEQAGPPQVILLTNEEDVLAWARLEAMTGALSVMGPGEGLAADIASGVSDTDATTDLSNPARPI